jgi:AcrR family transcriptional regulator
MAVKRSAPENIVLTAERLFAEQGIDAVSLRQINSAAGLKNNAAAHYHFGGKEGLTRAIVEYRAEGINQRRQQLLDRLGQGTDQERLRELVRALVLPMAEHVMGHPEGSFYFRFIIQAVDNSFSGAKEKIMHWHGGHYDQIRQQLRTLLDALPDEIFMLRFGLMLTLVVNSVAAWEREIPLDPTQVATGNFASRTSIFAANLIDAACGLLMAPMSEDTREKIDGSSAG